MSRERHWKNPAGEGRTCFVTSTCLDFVHLFERDEMRTRMALSLLEDCLRYGARLHGFVVMTHHLHLLVTPCGDDSISALMQKVKRNSAFHMTPLLLPSEELALQQQIGLNHRTFWKRSFRAVSIESERFFHQKLNYIHFNPVRSEFSEVPNDYPWCSARLYFDGLHDGFFGLDLEAAILVYRGMLPQ